MNAQNTMKVNADKRRRDAKIAINDFVFLSTQFLRLGSLSKLHERYIGPYRVLKVINNVSCKLQLPPTMYLHNVFHMSRLKLHVGKPIHITYIKPVKNIYKIIKMNNAEFSLYMNEEVRLQPVTDHVSQELDDGYETEVLIESSSENEASPNKNNLENKMNDILNNNNIKFNVIKPLLPNDFSMSPAAIIKIYPKEIEYIIKHRFKKIKNNQKSDSILEYLEKYTNTPFHNSRWISAEILLKKYKKLINEYDNGKNIPSFEDDRDIFGGEECNELPHDVAYLMPEIDA
jgi:hypothetical protein